MSFVTSLIFDLFISGVFPNPFSGGISLVLHKREPPAIDHPGGLAKMSPLDDQALPQDAPVKLVMPAFQKGFP